MFKIKIPATWEAVAVLVGTIIGSGVFLLPYAAISSGILISNIWLILLTVLLIVVHLVFGEIVLRTKHMHSFPGYAGKYLNKSAKKLLFVSSIITLSFSSVVYLLLATKFVTALLPNNFISFDILFAAVWIIFNLCACIDFSRASKINFLLSIGLIFLMLGASIYLFPYMNISNFQNFKVAHNWLTSYGIIFYSLTGLAAIPLTLHLLREKKANAKNFKKVIIVGSIVVAIAYLLFMNSIAMVSGGLVTEDAISGLIQFVGKPVILFGALIGILAVWTSYITFTHYLRNLLHHDFKWNKNVSILTVIFLPLVFFFVGINTIGDLVSLMGGVVGGLDGVIIFLMYFSAKKNFEREPEYSLKIKPILAWTIGGFFFISSVLQLVLKAINTK